MTVPILKGRENFDNSSKQMKVYAKLHCFETVFENDPYIDVGADGSSNASLIAQGVSAAMYERKLMAWVFLPQALKSDVDEGDSTGVHLQGSVGRRLWNGTSR